MGLLGSQRGAAAMSGLRCSALHAIGIGIGIAPPRGRGGTGELAGNVEGAAHAHAPGRGGGCRATWPWLREVPFDVRWRGFRERLPSSVTSSVMYSVTSW